MVLTNMSGVFLERASLSAPLPCDYVRSVLKKVGLAKSCFGYWPHELQVGGGQKGE